MDFLQRRQQVQLTLEAFQPDLLHSVFFQMANQYPEQPYIESTEKVMTYAETKVAVENFTTNLYKQDQTEKGNVSIIFPNYHELIIAKLAIGLLGRVSVPLNYRLKKDEMGYLIHQSDSSTIITIDQWRDSNYIKMLQELCPEVFEGKHSEKFPHLQRIIVYSPQGHKYEGTIDFNDLLQATNKDEVLQITNELLATSRHVEEVSDIMYTSGTTSLPKGVFITYDMMWRAALGSCINRVYEKGRKIYVPIPLYHCYGYIVGLVGVTLVGGSIIIQDDFEEEEALTLIRQFKADDMLCVPTIAIHLVRAFKKENSGVPLGLRAMYCAGAEVPITLWEQLKHELHIEELITGYGMTELGGGVLQTDPLDELTLLTQYVGKTIAGGHVGFAHLHGNNIEFKVRHIETREFLPFGQEGELVCRGPLVTKGYYNKPKETLETIEDEWLNTGDLGCMYDNGYIALTGRLKEIYRVGAENVAPKEIEEVFTAHEAVNQAYVVGVPDSVLGEAGLAWVVLEDNASLTKEALYEYITQKLARFKIPKYIQFVEESQLPKTATGKIQKFKLRELFKKEESTIH